MPVIVNELEIIVDPPAEASPEGPPTPAAPPPPPPGPLELNALLDRRARFAYRVLAH